MNEYKVVKTKLGLVGREQKFEDLLNNYAREGWHVVHITPSYMSVILERDKNR